MLPYNKNLNKFARDLRNNMTDAEWRLWHRIKMKQLKNQHFLRQKIIGNYIVDFYCHKAKLIIELDGGHHYSESGMEKDEIRDSFLNSLGITVLRFSDRDVFKNIDGVLQRIYENL
jgi:very-short-patch-repair endonuclease